LWRCVFLPSRIVEFDSLYPLQKVTRMLYSELGNPVAFMDMCGAAAEAIGLKVGQVGDWSISIDWNKGVWEVMVKTAARLDQMVSSDRVHKLNVEYNGSSVRTIRFQLDDIAPVKKYGISNIQTVPVLRRC
jgi:hypothetical protein